MAKTLHSPRRVATALAILLAGALLVGIAGAAGGAGDESAFRIPFPNGGDRASYAESLSGPDGTQAWNETVSWGREAAFRTPEGWQRAHLREVLGDRAFASVSVNGEEHAVYAGMRSWHATETGALLARDTVAHAGASGSSSGSPLGSQSEQTIELGRLVEFRSDGACGLAARLRAGVDLAEPVEVAECDGGGPRTYTFSGTDVVAGLEAHRFEARQDGAFLALWFSPLLPEPLRVEWSAEGHGGVREMVGFRPGQAPWSEGIPLPAEQPLPAPTLGPRMPWGPDDSGSDLPFTASQAWKAARDSATFTGFRDYLAQHPQARAIQAEYREQVRGSSTERSWSFHVGDGRSGYYLDATQVEAPPGAGLTDLAGVPSPLPRQASHTFHGAESSSLDLDLSDRLPSLEYAFAAWKAFTGSEAEATVWGLMSGHLEVGSAREGTTGPGSRQWDRVLVGFGDDGSVRHLHIINTTYRSERSGPFSGIAVEPRASVTAPVHVQGIQAMGMLASPAGATSVGLVSLLAAVAYYLAPLLKSGGMTLFSRVQGPALLEHPARRRIVELVEAEPGLHYQELVRRLGIGQGATEHHLRKLAEAGLVVRRRGTGFTCYFPPGRHEAAARAAPALKSDGARRILHQIRARPGLSAKEVAASTGLDPATVSHHLHRLQEAGLVEAQRNGRSLALHATAAANAAA
jgi:DNA-binding transcriptional ArsR family regulator